MPLRVGQVTDALVALQGVLTVVGAVASDVSDEAVEPRHNIGMLLLARGRAAEARQVLEPLHQDMCMVFGPDDEMTVETAEALAVIRLGLDGSASCPAASVAGGVSSLGTRSASAASSVRTSVGRAGGRSGRRGCAGWGEAAPSARLSAPHACGSKAFYG
ncbi:hypothetical protein [Streptomyces sp. NPDC005423]|uniref:hypothetical protein n=1 Tax=Streptomyces sp. NPDC005423 TaxID=3155343 RepID=UPI00339FA129